MAATQRVHGFGLQSVVARRPLIAQPTLDIVVSCAQRAEALPVPTGARTRAANNAVYAAHLAQVGRAPASTG